jgi:hypothetical protein
MHVDLAAGSVARGEKNKGLGSTGNAPGTARPFPLWRPGSGPHASPVNPEMFGKAPPNIRMENVEPAGWFRCERDSLLVPPRSSGCALLATPVEGYHTDETAISEPEGCP